jgi:hydroxyethylthiazole kinase-like uncharacterized protein yjeF
MAAGIEVLTVDEMYRADAFAIASGTPGTALMEAAGAAVADAIQQGWTQRPTLVLAGPGANGGDGWVVARLLAAANWPVRLALLGVRDRIQGDSAHHANLWTGPVEPASPDLLDGAEIIVNALFGAGLNRDLSGAALALVEAMAAHTSDVVAVDLPSGVNGDTGQVMGAAAQAATTVTFFRKKPSHLLFPGRLLAGAVQVANIGIPDDAAHPVQTFENTPKLWPGVPPRMTAAGHKYGRGHVLVAGGAETTGAPRMAARSGLRAGAGLATIACPRGAWPIYAASELAVMVLPMDAPSDFAAFLEDVRYSTVLLEPGLGLGEDTRSLVHLAATVGRKLVLDADALTVYAAAPKQLFDLIGQASAVVLTPHEGEFQRIFGDCVGSKLDRARVAAKRSGATIILKGSDTVIAAPDGRAAINANAPPTLATAGSGDVPAGMVAGLMSEGASVFDAAAAAVWLHGATALSLGRGMTASDLINTLPQTLQTLERDRLTHS